MPGEAEPRGDNSVGSGQKRRAFGITQSDISHILEALRRTGRLATSQTILSRPD